MTVTFDGSGALLDDGFDESPANAGEAAATINQNAETPAPGAVNNNSPTSSSSFYDQLPDLLSLSAETTGLSDTINQIFGSNYVSGDQSVKADPSPGNYGGFTPGSDTNAVSQNQADVKQKDYADRTQPTGGIDIAGIIKSATDKITKSMGNKPEVWAKLALDAAGGAYKDDQAKKAADLKWRQEQQQRDAHNNSVVSSRLSKTRGVINSALGRSSPVAPVTTKG